MEPDTVSDSDLSAALALIRDIPDFPISGILFKDVAPLLADANAFRVIISKLLSNVIPHSHIAGIEARGFILGSAMALQSGAGFVPIRKAGKLPFTTISESYGLEYGVDTLEVHIDAVGSSDSVLVVDDVLATGGTILATLDLLTRLGANISSVVVLIELEALSGRAKIEEKYPNIRINALLKVSA